MHYGIVYYLKRLEQPICLQLISAVSRRFSIASHYERKPYFRPNTAVWVEIKYKIVLYDHF